MTRRFLLLIPAFLLSAPTLSMMLSAQTPGSTATHKKTTPEHKAPASALHANYKESGSPTASVTLEEYADYECPHCKVVYQEWLPQIVNEYVKTGKVKLLHRDFPLPMHAHAREAAMYANAAGELGFYELVAGQIFKTQSEWSQNGNIDGEVAKVLAPGAMQQVRELMKTDPKVEQSMTQDVAMGTNVDHLTETPTFVIVKNGNRQPISGVPWITFKSYLDKIMAQK